MEKLLRIGIIDDHPGVRVEIRNLLASDKDIVVVGEGANGLDAIQLAYQMKPDVLLLDVELPLLRGDEVVKRLREVEPEVRVLAISSYDDPMYILGMLENGAVGYITKDEAPHSLIGAIHSIVDEKVKWISPSVANQVSKISLKNKTFTGRELAILRYIALRDSDEEICRTLEIDEQLLKRHVELLMRKFDVTSREGLIIAAQGVISTTNSMVDIP